MSQSNSSKKDIFTKFYLSSGLILEGIHYTNQKKMIDIQLEILGMQNIYVHTKNDSKSLIFVSRNAIQALMLTIPKSV